MGEWEGGGGWWGGWEVKGRLNHPWAKGQSHFVFSKTQKQPQCTCQAQTVVGSSLTPHADLLVHPTGTIWTIMNLQYQKNAACECCLSLVLSLVCLDSTRVWLSCQAIKWISVLAGLCRILANPVTYLWILTSLKFLLIHKFLSIANCMVVMYEILWQMLWVIKIYCRSINQQNSNLSRSLFYKAVASFHDQCTLIIIQINIFNYKITYVY